MKKTLFHQFSLPQRANLSLKLRRFGIPLFGVLLLAGVSFFVSSQIGLPNVKSLTLSADPLFAAAAGDKPTIALALSVEFPTVGAQYRDSVYSVNQEFLGYYDANSCYTYNNSPIEVATSSADYSNYKRFDKLGTATARRCTGVMDGFSGNFLNFASSSSIDMLRLALSGGDRLVDTGNSLASLTILQRAVLPNGDPTCMWNSPSNFPAKVLPRDSGNYLGAVPTLMRTAANTATADIQIANVLNQIYFGTTQGGDCNNTASYNLGKSTTSTAQVLGQTYGPGSLPVGYPAAASCANGASCGGIGLNEILYGSSSGGNNKKWVAYATFGAVNCNQTSFPNGTSSGSEQCYVRPYIGPTFVAPSSTAGLNSDGFFYARVQVCNVDALKTLVDTRDYSFCTQQPNGFYKPTGSIQKYSDQLRLAAFGYLMDQTNSNSGGRYGGVLRAPMKYVGARTFDINGADNTPNSGNANAEWDANTGVFAANPDGDTTQVTPISGVINYLNKFGRTGPVQGRYKIYDPVGELFGEALRYLQGLGPTTEAVSALTNTMYDGFPVFTNWTDPYGNGRLNSKDYTCLKTNIVMVGDVNSWDSNRLFTRTANTANNLADFNYWNGIVNTFEAGNITSYIDGQGVSRTTSNPNAYNSAGVTSVTGNSVVASQAYWARTQDIRGTAWTSQPALQRPGMRVKSFFFDVNEGSSSNNAYYRQNQDQFFRASKYGGFETDPANPQRASFNTFGNPFRKQDGTVDNNVWQDNANPGEASTYYLSSSARATLTAFDAIFSRASTSARSIAKSAVANKNITSVGSTIYQGAFDTSDWSGDVLSIPVNLTGTSTVTIDQTPRWSAATRLSSIPAVSRTIVIGNTGTTAIPTATAFVWANLNAGMQQNLAKLTPSSTPDSLGQDRLNYLRGDKSKEGAPFRIRNKLLGDIVNSGIVYSGTPTTNITPNSSAYTSFFNTNQSRTPAIFVGANDGMLHAFSATTGDELFGYIPSWMGPKLAALTATTYNGNHQAYVDATAVVAEAQVGSAGTAADWKTVLVSGTGAGGPGIFALDVTNPSAFSASNVMWEFTKQDDADMGFVVGRPQILKLRTSAPATTPATYRWFAVVASGVNNYVPFPDAAGTFSATGNPALFLLALDKPVGTAWTSTGSTPNYYKLTVPVDTILTTANATGLLNFSALNGSVGELAQIYMGDLHGKVWKLDFTQHGTTEWTFDLLSYYKTGVSPSVSAYPMYVAKTGAGAVQPISMPPVVLSGSTVGGVNTYYVGFGTGKYLEVSDKTSTLQNSFYSVYDNGTSNSPAGGAVIPSRGRLQAGLVNTTTFAVTVAPFKWGRASSDTDTTQRSGYYFDYVASGERTVSPISAVGDTLRFGSLIPAAVAAAGSCASGGGGNVYDIDADTGVGTYSSSLVGLFGESLIFNISSADTFTTSNSTGRRTKTTRSVAFDVGSSGVSASGTPKQVTTVAGRLSWRQINNYQDLKAP